MSDLPKGTKAGGILFALGAFGLLVAMVTDTLAVLGRHIGLPLLGSVEIVEAAILLAASAAILIATLNGAHAVVHLLVERLRPGAAALLRRVADGLSALFFAALAIGNGWFAADMWFAHEASDLLHLPFRPLHAVATLACAASALSFLWRAVAPEKRA